MNKSDIMKSVLAGFMIGMGGYSYANQNNQYIGALLFSIGLITVILLQLPLYTGKIAFVQKNNWLYMIEMLICNFIGAGISGIMFSYDTQDIVYNKLSHTPIEVLVSSIGCGVMIFLAVKLYNNSKNIFIIVLPVMVFILSGFEHCIADMYYFTSCNMTVNLETLSFILLVVVGNSIGAIVPYHIIKM